MRPRGLTDDGFPLGEMNGGFVAKFIWAYAFLFVYGFTGEIILFRRKRLPLLLDQSKQKYSSIFIFSANTFPSDQIETKCPRISRCPLNFTIIAAG